MLQKIFLAETAFRSMYLPCCGKPCEKTAFLKQARKLFVA